MLPATQRDLQRQQGCPSNHVYAWADWLTSGSGQLAAFPLLLVAWLLFVWYFVVRPEPW
jgi:hypothetical protein